MIFFSLFCEVVFFKDCVNLIDQRPNPLFIFDAFFNITPVLLFNFDIFKYDAFLLLLNVEGKNIIFFPKVIKLSFFFY